MTKQEFIQVKEYFEHEIAKAKAEGNVIKTLAMEANMFEVLSRMNVSKRS